MDNDDQRKHKPQAEIEGLRASYFSIQDESTSTENEHSEQALSTDGSTSVDKHTLTEASDPIPSLPSEKTGDSAPVVTKKPSLTRQILALAIPTLGATIAQPLFLTIDSAMVGHLGAEKIAGMSLAMIIINTVYGMSIFLAYSTTAETAQAMGAGNERRARELGVHAMWLAAIIGVSLALLLAICGIPLLHALGAAPEIMPYAQSFLYASLPGLTASLITMAATGVLRGMKDTTTPLIAAGAGAALNIGLNAFLIYGINLGIVGSGIGTSIVSTIMAISLIIILARPAHTLGVSLRPSLTGIRQSARVGGPLLARSIAIRLAFLTSIWSATAISVNGLAAYQVVMSAWQIPLFLLDSLAIASQTLVGFAIGSGDRSQLRTLLRTLSWWGIFAGIIIGALTAALSPWIPSFFVSEAVVRNMAIPAVIVNAVFFPAQSHAFLLDGVLIGAGRGASLAKAAFLNLAILLPALWLFSVARPSLTETQAVAVLIGLVTGLYMLTRALTNSWITWFSPKHALIPRHEAGAQSAE